MGLINCVEKVEQLEAEEITWATEILAKSPIPIRCLKAVFDSDNFCQYP